MHRNHSPRSNPHPSQSRIETKYNTLLDSLESKPNTLPLLTPSRHVSAFNRTDACCSRLRLYNTRPNGLQLTTPGPSVASPTSPCLLL
eukprot:2711278-Rhodomonas_salina.2